MKKISVILVAATAAILALSCQRSVEFDTPAENLERTPVQKTFKAIFPSDLDSKVTLNESGKTGWAIGDVITIHGKATDELKTITLDGVTNTISADNKTATFTVTLDMTPDDYGSDGFYAQYPHSAYAEYESNRPRYFNCFNNTNTLLLSGVYDDANDAFVFYNVTGAMSFIVDGSSFGGFDEYMIVGKNDETVGFDHFNTRVATGAMSLCHYSTSGAKTSVRAAVNDNGSTVNYIYFPVTETNDTEDTPGKRAECVDFSGGFYIYFFQSGVITHMASTSADIRIERQSLIRLGDITSKVKPYSLPESHTASRPAITGAEDLGASSAGTANSYIVRADVVGNANKVFKFKAVRGNSTTKVNAINKVVVLWETDNTSTAVNSNDIIAEADFDKRPANDYYEICFKMPGTLKAGNAVIAAMDIYENILWSWHIWVPSSEVTNNTYGLGSQSWMDRNLGALDVPDASTTDYPNPRSYGLFYAWGRKDPFPGLTLMTANTPAATTGSFTMAGSIMSPEETYSHPTTFVGTASDDIYSWTHLDVTSGDDTAGLWAADKTINDPCPPGYIVPAFINNEGLWKGKDATNFSYDGTHMWVKAGSDPYIVFPIVGYIDGNQASPSIRNYASRVYILSSTNTATEGLSYYLRFNKDGTSSNAWERQARAGIVRCVTIPEP